MIQEIFPLREWPSGITQASTPANDNALRNEAMARPCLGVANDESSPENGDVWIVGDTPIGAFATFSENDIVLYQFGSWYAWHPVPGIRLTMEDGTRKIFVGESTNAWEDEGAVTVTAGDVSYDNTDSGLTADNVQEAIDALAAAGGGGSTQGKQAIYVAAAAMRPSATGGCAPLAAAATSSNHPDLVSLDFDAGTDEFAQFSLVMPKKWNAGTLTARFHWTHGATTTNFAVVWGLQAVAVSNDDTIDVAYGTAVTVTDTGGTTSDLYTSDETSSITVGGSPAKEDMVYFRAYRDADAGGDTMAVDAKLLGITVYCTTDADTDA